MPKNKQKNENRKLSIIKLLEESQNNEKLRNFLLSTISLLGFLKNDLSIPKDERIAAAKKYQEGKELLYLLDKNSL